MKSLNKKIKVSIIWTYPHFIICLIVLLIVPLRFMQKDYWICTKIEMAEIPYKTLFYSIMLSSDGLLEL